MEQCSLSRRKTSSGGFAAAGRRAAIGAALCILGLVSGPHAAVSSPVECAAGLARGLAVDAADARTLRLEDGRLLRLEGIEPFSLLEPDLADAEQKAARALAELGLGPVRYRAVARKPDRYGRTRALVFTADGFLNARLAEEGLFVAVPPLDHNACVAETMAAEERGRRAKKGFWENGARRFVRRPSDVRGGVTDFVIVEGMIRSVGARPRRTYLNFTGAREAGLSAVIEGKDRDRFGSAEAIDRLAGRVVRVRGFLSGAERPALSVRSPLQVETFGAAAPGEGYGDLDSRPEGGQGNPHGF
ncbi:thermonuclease family protein [Faunimonas sp. B44]|uniref:thermonuclease family protein n=1 Tax=Faunimonas sp. B44 TaxID=3461493 RepID=UPI004043FC0E